eukprot:1160973-Pelagomonas_calceolata.AAC.8
MEKRFMASMAFQEALNERMLAVPGALVIRMGAAKLSLHLCLNKVERQQLIRQFMPRFNDTWVAPKFRRLGEGKEREKVLQWSSGYNTPGCDHRLCGVHTGSKGHFLNTPGCDLTLAFERLCGVHQAPKGGLDTHLGVTKLGPLKGCMEVHSGSAWRS